MSYGRFRLILETLRLLQCANSGWLIAFHYADVPLIADTGTGSCKDPFASPFLWTTIYLQKVEQLSASGKMKERGPPCLASHYR